VKELLDMGLANSVALLGKWPGIHAQTDTFKILMIAGAH